MSSSYIYAMRLIKKRLLPSRAGLEPIASNRATPTQSTSKPACVAPEWGPQFLSVEPVANENQSELRVFF